MNDPLATVLNDAFSTVDVLNASFDAMGDP